MPMPPIPQKKYGLFSIMARRYKLGTMMASNKLHIGVVAPAGYSDPIVLDTGLQRLRALGHTVTVHPNTYNRDQIFAGTAIDRAHSVSEFLHNPALDLVLATRGIHGAQHILPALLAEDYADNAPPFVAFSDNTFLLNPLHFQKGVKCVYGPGVITIAEGLPDDELQHMLDCAMRAPAYDIGKLINADSYIIKPGTATGKLVGGNFMMLNSLLATPYDWPSVGTILFFEDLKEFLFRVDRQLQQLKMAGKLDKLAGVIIGNFSHIMTKGASHEYSIDAWQYFTDFFKDAAYPVIGKAAFGHAGPMYSVPIGATVKLTANAGQSPKLELLSF